MEGKQRKGMTDNTYVLQGLPDCGNSMIDELFGSYCIDTECEDVQYAVIHKFVAEEGGLESSKAWRNNVTACLQKLDPSLRGRFLSDGFVIETHDIETYHQLLQHGFEDYAVEK
jgi:hypothetical protein